MRSIKIKLPGEFSLCGPKAGPGSLLTRLGCKSFICRPAQGHIAEVGGGVERRPDVRLK